MAARTLPNANETAARWAERMRQSTQKITDRVNAVTEAPGIAAARKKDLWVANVAAAKEKWATKVAAITLDEWKTRMIQKGIPRIATGAMDATGKFELYLNKLFPILRSIMEQLPAREKGNIANNLRRVEIIATKLNEAKRQGRL